MKRSIALTIALVLGFAVESSALTLLGTKDFANGGSLGGEMSVNGITNTVYASGGMGQAPGILKFDTTNPGAISVSTFAGGGFGGGVAVDQVTGNVATTNGGGTFRLLNAAGSVIDTESIAGCGGSLVAGGGRFGVSTQCSCIEGHESPSARVWTWGAEC